VAALLLAFAVWLPVAHARQADAFAGRGPQATRLPWPGWAHYRQTAVASAAQVDPVRTLAFNVVRADQRPPAEVLACSVQPKSAIPPPWRVSVLRLEARSQGVIVIRNLTPPPRSGTGRRPPGNRTQLLSAAV
jgi:hypothetical protein